MTLQSIYHCQVKYAITFSCSETSDNSGLRAEDVLIFNQQDPSSSMIIAWLVATVRYALDVMIYLKYYQHL